jgi:hypothetical protein
VDGEKKLSVKKKGVETKVSLLHPLWVSGYCLNFCMQSELSPYSDYNILCVMFLMNY